MKNKDVSKYTGKYWGQHIALYFLHLARRLNAGDTISNKAMQMYLFVAYHEYLLKYDKCLIREDFEAWEDGFTIKCVYDMYRQYGKSSISFNELVVFNKNLYEDEDVSFLYDMYMSLSCVNLYHLKQQILESDLYKNKFNIKINKEITVNDIIKYPISFTFLKKKKKWSIYIPRASSTAESDSYCTPYYGVIPILEFIKPKSTIWCPFDKEDSNFVKCFKDNNFNVIHSHIDDNKNFLDYYPNEDIDLIISNPPFSIKDKILKRLFEINKPFALIYPLPSIQHSGIFDQLKECEFLVFDKRINFLHYETKECMKGVSFASIYLCKKLLPEKIMFRRLSSS